MRRTQRRWLLIGGGSLIVLAMGAVLWFLRGSGEIREDFAATPYEREVDRELWDFWVTLRDADGNLLWRIFGKHILIRKNGDYLFEGLTEGHYYRRDQPWIRFRADRGEYRAATRDVTVEGNVQVQAIEEDLSLETERVEWTERERLLAIPQLGRLVYQNYVLHTQRVLYRVDERLLECPDPIKAEGEGDLLEATGLTVNLEEKVWRLRGPGRLAHWIALGATLAILPRPSAGQPASPEQVEGGKKEVLIHYEKVVEWRQDSGVMEGNVVIAVPQDELTVYADRVEYDRKKEVARATGGLRLVDPENTLTGKVMLVYLKERRAVVDQEVRLVHTPSQAGAGGPPPADEEDRIEEYKKEATILTCSRLEYFYRKPRKAVATGQVRMEQPRVGRFATSQKAFYFEETDTLRLEGGVQAQDEEGQSFRGEQIEVGVEEEWVRAPGPGHFVIFVEDEEEEGEAPPGSSPPGEPPPPPEEGAPPAEAPAAPGEG